MSLSLWVCRSLGQNLPHPSDHGWIFSKVLLRKHKNLNMILWVRKISMVRIFSVPQLCRRRSSPPRCTWAACLCSPAVGSRSWQSGSGRRWSPCTLCSGSPHCTCTSQTCYPAPSMPCLTVCTAPGSGTRWWWWHPPPSWSGRWRWGCSSGRGRCSAGGPGLWHCHHLLLLRHLHPQLGRRWWVSPCHPHLRCCCLLHHCHCFLHCCHPLWQCPMSPPRFPRSLQVIWLWIVCILPFHFQYTF